MALLLISAATTGMAATSDFEVKAAFIFQFTHFVQWPENAFPSANAPFVIGILGTDPIEPALDAIVRGEHVGRHPITVRELQDRNEESSCQILYVTEEGEDLLSSRRLENAPILTVGESDSFFRKGGVVQFYLDRRHVRLRINLTEARLHLLVISGKLLRVADVTGGTSSLLEFPGSLADAAPPDPLMLPARRPAF